MGDRKTLVAAGVIVALGVGFYGMTWAPVHYSQLRATIADGTESFGLPGGSSITPDEGWRVEPVVETMWVWPFRSWSVLLGDTGTEWVSPDRRLVIDVAADGAGDLGADAAERLEQGEGVMTEELASGVTIRHIDDGGDVVAELKGTGEAPLYLRASTRGDARMGDYRPALSSFVEKIR